MKVPALQCTSCDFAKGLQVSKPMFLCLQKTHEIMCTYSNCLRIVVNKILKDSMTVLSNSWKMFRKWEYYQLAFILG